MPDLSISTWILLVFSTMGMFLMGFKITEFVSNLLYQYGYLKWKFTYHKDKKNLAIASMVQAFDLSKETIGEYRAIRLSNGYTMLLISDSKAQEIWDKADAGKAECGTSSITHH